MRDMKPIEESYLGAAFIDPTILLEHPLDPLDFRFIQHQEVYNAMREVYAEHGNVDTMLVSQKTAADITPAFITGLIANTITTMHAGSYAEEIRKAAQGRELFTVAQEMVRDIQEGAEVPEKYIDKITRAIRVTGGTKDLTETADNYLTHIERRELDPSDVWGIPSPWEAFNRVTGGLHRKESTLIFGKSGIGKTVAVLQMGYHAAALGYKVDFYELEMSAENLLARLVAMHSKVPTRLVNSGKMNPTQKRDVLEAVNFIRSLPIRISDETHWTSSEIRADQQKKNGNRADMVIVDYLALLNDKAENAYERVEGAAKTLRQMAKDLDQVVLTVSSQVKDGSIKGTAEVKYAQDMTWSIEKPSNLENDRLRDLIPDKLRNVSEFKMVALKMAEDLPLLEEFNYEQAR